MWFCTSSKSCTQDGEVWKSGPQAVTDTCKLRMRVWLKASAGKRRVKWLCYVAPRLYNRQCHWLYRTTPEAQKTITCKDTRTQYAMLIQENFGINIRETQTHHVSRVTSVRTWISRPWVLRIFSIDTKFFLFRSNGTESKIYVKCVD